jgi:hypothetical protein
LPSNLAGKEVKVKVDNYRKRVREDVSVTVHTICKEELSHIHAKSYDMVTEVTEYNNIQDSTCKERRNFLDSEQHPEDISKIVFSEEVLRRANNSRPFRIHRTDNSGTIILFFAGEDSEYLLRSRTSVFF